MIRFVFILAMVAISIYFPGTQAVAQTTMSYIVNDDGTGQEANPGDAICSTTTGKCTLCAAIQESNLDGTHSHISFSKPMDITDPALPSLMESYTTIDASNQWNHQTRQPGILINSCRGLWVEGNYAIVKGIRFYDFSTSIGPGVRLIGNNATIGGDVYNERNVFVTPIGVRIHGKFNDINGNYFGTVEGMYPYSIDLKHGVFLDSGANNNTVENNIIGGQILGSGIECWADNNVIINNIIGLNKAESNLLPNLQGIELANASNNKIESNRIAVADQRPALLSFLFESPEQIKTLLHFPNQ